MPSPLIQSLETRHGLPRVGLDAVDAFLNEHEAVVLFFAGNPKQFPESNDVAVILPELLAAFRGRLSGALVEPEAEAKLQARFGFTQWPALVFLRRGDYLGTIARVQDWTAYLEQIEALLQADPVRAPSINVPVVEAGSGSLH